MSELERKRLANIERNRKALQKFQLEELSSQAFSVIHSGNSSEKHNGKADTERKTVSVRKRRRENPALPLRRSRRLEGIKIEDRNSQNEFERNQDIHMRLASERARVDGEKKLEELVKAGEWNKALDIMQTFSGKVSQGDFFFHTDINDKNLESCRQQLSSLSLDARDVRVTPERITSLIWHAFDSKIIVTGDKLGNIGIWNAEMTGDSGIFGFKPHSRAISTILVDKNNTTLVYSASYDGSIRKIDMEKLTSTDIFTYDPNPQDPVGISDMALIDPHVLYYTTLIGTFGRYDVREPNTKPTFVLSEKKIGGFAVNPRNSSEIATASLDRTMKIWDLRSQTPLLYGEYESRLSVSAASWNNANEIVCNGYDNTINVFKLDKELLARNEPLELEPVWRIRHNCQTGRWVSILKARWQESPKDGINKFVIANMKKYIDVFSSEGQQLAHKDGDIVTAVPAVVQFHRSNNWIAGGTASGKIYMFTDSFTK